MMHAVLCLVGVGAPRAWVTTSHKCAQATFHICIGIDMPAQSSKVTAHPNEEELVTLDLDAVPHSRSFDGSETLLAKLKRCGNGKDSTPLPWPQLSVVMVVSLSEGAWKLNFRWEEEPEAFHVAIPLSFNCNSLKSLSSRY